MSVLLSLHGSFPERRVFLAILPLRPPDVSSLSLALPSVHLDEYSLADVLLGCLLWSQPWNAACSYHLSVPQAQSQWSRLGDDGVGTSRTFEGFVIGNPYEHLGEADSA